ncbi:DUF397 domain-containing protein [Streptomyces sp. NPDC001661]
MAITKGAQPTWIKSSYSAGNGACVEIKSPAAHAVDVRDSKDPQGPNLAFAPASWSAFVTEMSRVDA